MLIGPVFNTSGELLYFFASQLDVTRRRESERSYLQAQKMEAVGQLTAGLAHRPRHARRHKRHRTDQGHQCDRSRPARPHTTGYNEELVIEGPLRSGLDVLGKLYRRAELLDRIEQAPSQNGLTETRRRPSDFGPAEA